jgi:hypothetical protein
MFLAPFAKWSDLTCKFATGVNVGMNSSRSTGPFHPVHDHDGNLYWCQPDVRLLDRDNRKRHISKAGVRMPATREPPQHSERTELILEKSVDYVTLVRWLSFAMTAFALAKATRLNDARF